jgi:hypothetical protein
MDADLARRLATRALALARAGTDTGGAAVVLRGLARGDSDALRLARSRCLAALDQQPGDDAARRAVALLDAALDPPA